MKKKKIKCKEIHLKMEKLLGNTNLSINFWLLKGGLMYGHLNNGIQTTKFTIFRFKDIIYKPNVFTIFHF